MTAPENHGRQFADLSATGLLWLINRVVFHPRGLALAIHVDDAGVATGWTLLGDGKKCFTFNAADDDESFARLQQFLSAHRDETAPKCTGIAASWCPVHGDCTCFRHRDDFTLCATCGHDEGDHNLLGSTSACEADVDGTCCPCAHLEERYADEEDDACPLHGRASNHAEGVLG